MNDLETESFQQPLSNFHISNNRNYSILQNKECNSCRINQTNQGGI